jgi:hypothetical protein
MRPSRDGSPGPSETPIYDALYSEYLRGFRTLPGDRSGEEDLDFKGFGTGMRGGRGGFFSYGGHTGQTGGQANSGGQQRGWHPHQTGRHAAHQPAALPPAPRKGL